MNGLRLSAIAVVLTLACPASGDLCGDVNGDGQIKVTDALYVLKTAVGIPVALDCLGGEDVCGEVTGPGVS